MRHAVVAALLLAGCATGESILARPTLPVAFVDPGDLRAEIPRTRSESAETDTEDPAAVAMDTVASYLADQTLTVVDIDGQVLDGDEGHATVRVTVVHTSGRGRPHQSAYDLELARQSGGWRVVGVDERT